MDDYRRPVAMGREAAVRSRPLPQVRCVCGQRLFDGELDGEIKCARCKRIVKFIAKGKKTA